MAEEGFDFQAWYEKHGKALNKQRRSRYHTDPEYRARVLELNRKTREKRRQQEREKSDIERAAQKLGVRARPWKTVEVELASGRRVTMLTIGALAKVLNLSVQAVRIWEKQGLLPETPYRNAKGDRLYRPQDVETLVAVLKAQGRLPPAHVHSDPPLRGFAGTMVRGKRQFEVVLYRIGALARALDRTVVTVEQMEQREALPSTPYRWSGYRLYTVEMIQAAHAALTSRGGAIRGKVRWQSFHDEVVDEWTKQGVFETKLVTVRSLATETA